MLTKSIAIIPARYKSQRFEGKPLINILDKTMIRRVYENVLSFNLFNKVIVATDDYRIEEECIKHSIEYRMTDTIHINGTERITEVVEKLQEKYDIIVNIQGDEPFIKKEALISVLKCFDNKEVKIATLIKKISNIDELKSNSIIKLVKNKKNKALYFSRNIIPFNRDLPIEKWLEEDNYFKHIGLYAFRNGILEELKLLEESFLERLEKLEQLRWIENGYDIYANEVFEDSISIDTPQDYEFVMKNIEKYL